jgi:uncharacterized membrane protein
MNTIKQSINIKAPPSNVYRYLVDVNHMPEWLSSMEEVRNIWGTGVGQTYEWTYRMVGVRLKGETKVIADEPDRMRKTQTTGGVESTWTFEMVPAGNDTTLNVSIDYKIPLPVLGRLAEKLVKRRNEREAQISLEHLKDLVEAEEQRRHAAAQ